MLRTVAAVVATAGLLALPAVASATPTLVSPTSGAGVAIPDATTFTWQLNGDTGATIKVASDQSMTTVSDSAKIDNDATLTYTTTYPLFAGTWYWQVTASNAGTPTASEIWPFTVPVDAKPLGITAKAAKGRHKVTGLLLYRTNIASPHLQLVIYYLGKRIFNSGTTFQHNRKFNGVATQLPWYMKFRGNASLPKHARLKATFILSGNKVTRTIKKTLVV